MLRQVSSAGSGGQKISLQSAMVFKSMGDDDNVVLTELLDPVPVVLTDAVFCKFNVSVKLLLIV